MEDVAIAHAGGREWSHLAKSCADQLRARGGAPNLGFLYATDALAADLPSILTFVRERTRIECWVGAVGFGVCVTGREYHDEPAVVAMTGRLPERSFALIPPLVRAADAAAPELAARLRGLFGDLGPGLAVVHGDPRNAETRETVTALAAASSCFLVGGLSASRGETFQIAGRVTESGLSGVAISSEVPVAVGVSQGCTPVGPTRTVTAGRENVILELDGEPALEALMKDVGARPGESLAESLHDIHAALPVVGSDTGDYLVRNLVGVGPADGWVAVGEPLRPGDRLFFCRHDAESAEVDLRRMLDGLRRRAGATPRAGVYFSCVARGPNLFDGDSREMALIREALGDVPVVGFFGNGEISHDRLYGYTGVLALFT